MAADTLWWLKLQFVLLNNELKQIFPSKVRIFSCSSDGQKSYCQKTSFQQIHFFSQQFAWKVGRDNVQISCQMPNMETRFIPMLQSSSCISKIRFYCTQIDVGCSSGSWGWGGWWPMTDLRSLHLEEGGHRYIFLNLSSFEKWNLSIYFFYLEYICSY